MKTRDTPVGFALVEIKTEQFAILQDNHTPEDPTSLITRIQFKVDPKIKQIGIVLGFNFSKHKGIFLTIQASCHFRIEEGSWNNFLLNDESKGIIPKGFISHLSMITLGTTRGILFAKTEGTQFSSYIIPLTNIDEAITNDVKFDL